MIHCRSYIFISPYAETITVLRAGFLNSFNLARSVKPSISGILISLNIIPISLCSKSLLKLPVHYLQKQNHIPLTYLFPKTLRLRTQDPVHHQLLTFFQACLLTYFIIENISFSVFRNQSVCKILFSAEFNSFSNLSLSS